MTSAVLDVPFELSAVGRARRWVVERCGARLGDEASQQVLELLTSELVANAIVHGCAPVSVEVDCGPGRVRVLVNDANGVLPERRLVGPEATGGRGVALVALLATSWGARPSTDGAGKAVWFECSGAGYAVSA